MKHRGGHGVTCHALSDKTGLLSGINIVDDNDDVMIITDAGTMIRTSAANIPTYSRSAGGVRVMRLAEGQKIVNFTKLARQDEIEDAIVEAENDESVAPIENLPAEDENLTLEQNFEQSETEDTVEE
jgi:DNA gyrase subunit A